VTITHDRRRFESVKRIVRIEEDPVFRECLAATLTLTYTDEQLHTYSNARTDLLIRETINEACDQHEGNSEMYLSRLKMLAAAMSRVKAKYGDESQPGHAKAMSSGAKNISRFQSAIHLSSMPAGTEHNLEGITPAQAEMLLAVTFLHEQSGAADVFQPVFKNFYNTSLADFRMTRQIMERPTAAEQHASEYTERALRRRELERLFGQTLVNNDNMVDYDEELLGQLLALKKSPDGESLWFEVERHVIQRHSTDFIHTAEVLFFMKPFLSKFGVSYLATTIPSLHYYEELPQYEDYSKAPEDVRALCTALLRVVHAIDSLPLTHPHRLSTDGTIDDPELMHLILEHPDRAELIADTIIQRETADPVMLRGVVESGALGAGFI
jgi:hypothetical protein